MPKCKNDSKRNYTGKEPSPKGLGYCGHAEKIGQKRKGKDGNMWVIKKTKTGVKRWVKINPKQSKKLNLKIWLKDFTILQKKIVKKLLGPTKKELEKVDIQVVIVPNHITDQGFYFSDYPWDVADEKLGNDFLDSKFIIIVLKINENNRLEEINIQHNNITYNTKKTLIKIFKKNVGSKFKWTGKTNDAMFITF